MLWVVSCGLWLLLLLLLLLVFFWGGGVVEDWDTGELRAWPTAQSHDKLTDDRAPIDVTGWRCRPTSSPWRTTRTGPC